MKILIYSVNILLIGIIGLTLAASIATEVFNKPVLLTVIKSNSMYPLWQRGDMLNIRSIPISEQIHKGEMVLFKSKEGLLASKGWIAHRIVNGDRKRGFITKGDANEKSDQALKETPPIQRKWITAKVATIAGHPLVIPKIGFLTLWVQHIKSVKYVLPLIALLLAGIIAYQELMSQKKRSKRNNQLDLQWIYFLSGLTIMVVSAATMIINTQFITLNYHVSDHKGVLSGSEVGILQLGTEKKGQLSKLQNSGIIPLDGVVSVNNPQVSVNHKYFTLYKGQIVHLNYSVRAKKIGHYHTRITIGLFYPLLPAPAIRKLAEINYWLAIGAISFIPAMPFIFFPFADRRLRRPLVKAFRKRKRRLFN